VHQKERISIQTGAGLKACVLTGRNETEYEFEITMGEAIVGAELPIKLAAGEVLGVPVSMGNPHYVLFVSDFAEHWQAKASEIQSSSEFTQGVNVEIVVIDGEHDVRARFFERGVGETQSSGTGFLRSGFGGSWHRQSAIARARVRSRRYANGAARRKFGVPARRRPLVCRGEFF